MIPDITEVNFPSYATLHQASVSFTDMGDRTITTQVKIDGDIAPEFIGTNGEDWEVTFKGERFIHPLRKPQATKNNESRYSLIDMTFYHWAEYQMKRYYFVSLANIDSGTAIADKYVVPMNLNLQDFARAIDDVLAYYFPDGELYVYKSGGSYIYPDLQDYDPQVKAVEISYTYIWDLLQKTQELYNCRWTIEQDGNGNYAIKFGYPVTELSHVFKYGYEDGLLSLERQVQDANIRNQILGRGGEKNLPRLYFKDYEKFHPNSTDSAYSNYGQIPDPDAIPELENIYFSELRDSNFRAYVQGWKTNPHRQLSTPDGWVGLVETYDATRGATDWAYKKGHEDEAFDPVEYVKDDDSIATYGLLQGGLENQEDIYPSIQGMEIELPCDKGAHDSLAAGHEVETLADEVVSVDPVLTDEISAGDSLGSYNVREVTFPVDKHYPGVDSHEFNNETEWKASGISAQVRSFNFHVPNGYVGYLELTPGVTAFINFDRTVTKQYRVSPPRTSTVKEHMRFDVSQKNDCIDQVEVKIQSFEIYNLAGELVTKRTLPEGNYYVKVKYSVPKITFNRIYNDSGRTTSALCMLSKVDHLYWDVSTAINYTLIPFNGTLVSNEDATDSDTIAAGAKKEFSIEGDNFTVSGDGALVVEVPVTVTPQEYALVESKIHIIDTNTSQEVPNSNIPAGSYRLFVDVTVRNLDSDNSHAFTVTLDDTYIYNVQQDEQWQPTFDIWVKNIFDTDRTQFPGGEAGDDQYVASVWEPLRTTEEMAVTFISGNLSYSSDWEFKIASGGIHYDNSRIISVEDENHILHDIRSEWRLTLIKSEAEADAIHSYVPYKGFNAAAGDRFFLTGIYLPWAYVYAAERELTQKKEEELDKNKEVQPTWVVGLDKVRIQTLSGTETEKLIDSVHPGDLVRIKDDRFTEAEGVLLYVSSITYNWQGNGEIIPEVEIVLSDQLQTSLSAVEQIRSDVQVISNQIKSYSNIERTIRRIGDAAYLRKDGIQEESNSPTTFRREIKSANFVHGLVEGEGWSAYIDPQGKSVIEIDKLIIRDDVLINNIVANQVTAIGGKEILSAASMRISGVELTEEGFVCYYDQHDATVGNLFVVGDIVMSQTFNPENDQRTYYRSKVVEAGNGFITLGNGQDITGNATPQEGDVIVQYGHASDVSRQFVIIRDVIGGGYEQMLYGLNSLTAPGIEYYFAGGKDSPTTEPVELADKDGVLLGDHDGEQLIVGNEIVHHIAPRWFVGDASAEYAKWESGELTVRGRITVLGANGDVVMGPSTVIAGGSVLSSLIGVVDSSDVLQAGINALDDYDDTTHGTLMIFAGANGNTVADITAAPFRVYEDGALYATYGEIGGFSLGEDHIGISVPSGQIYYPWAYLGSAWFENIFFINGERDFYASGELIRYNAGIGVGIGDDVPSAAYFALTASDRLSPVACGIYLNVKAAEKNYAINVINGSYHNFIPEASLNSSTLRQNYPYGGALMHVYTNTSAQTVPLPRNSEGAYILLNGKTFFVFHSTTSPLTFEAHQSSAHPIYDVNTGPSQAVWSWTSTAREALIFIYVAEIKVNITGTNYTGAWCVYTF